MPGLAERIRLRPTDCSHAAHVLPALAAGEEGVDRRARAHVEHCLRCQAEVVHYRRMLRQLGSLRAETLPPAPETLATVLAALDAARQTSEERGRVLRAALLGGLTVGLAGAAGLVLWGARRRLDYRP